MASELIAALRAVDPAAHLETTEGLVTDVHHDPEQPSTFLEAIEGDRPMTCGGILEALDQLDAARPITVSTDSWWLNIEAVTSAVRLVTRDDFDTRQW